ncbi:hypothetical protein [Vibrio parahaemolyticus]|uniref:hypothetical protein n=1 Tax=Vibrio parahaemolyticus TaxID=670 RepID=UPI00226B2E6A|nr:hypothetical protein [Vibrio parahaemolyticus]MCX8941240.1 hypothetical protein [Vibrio parahaemolyticus]
MHEHKCNIGEKFERARFSLYSKKCELALGKFEQALNAQNKKIEADRKYKEWARRSARQKPIPAEAWS